MFGKMIMTYEERAEMIQTQGYTLTQNGDILTSRGGMVNPWVFERHENGEWRTLVGVQTDAGAALEHLYKLKAKSPECIFRMYRANDLDLYVVTTK